MTKASILFADNDRDFLVTRKEFLEQEGYTVIPASDTSTVRRLLDQSSIDLAILDIRLVDDDDEKDVSGLALAKATAYRAIPKIILTGFPSTDAARESLRQDLDGVPPAVDFLAKKEGPDAMIIAVQRALSVSRKQWLPLLALVMLLGAVLAGATAIIYDDPRWLIGTAALGVLFATSMWWLAVE